MNPDQNWHCVVTVSEILAAGAVALLCDVLRVHNRRISRRCVEFQILLHEAQRSWEWGSADAGSTLEEARLLARKLLSPTCINEAQGYAPPSPTDGTTPAKDVGSPRNWEMLLKARQRRNPESCLPPSESVNQAARFSLRDRAG